MFYARGINIPADTARIYNNKITIVAATSAAVRKREKQTGGVVEKFVETQQHVLGMFQRRARWRFVCNVGYMFHFVGTGGTEKWD